MTDTQTSRPRDLAIKRPANAPVVPQPRDDGRTIDGHWRAKRHGPGGFKVLTVFLFLLVAFLFAGFLLSTLQQHT